MAAALAAGLYLMLRGGLLQAVELRAPSNTRRQNDFSVDENGYVTYPNVNTVTEMTNLIDASRGYEANATAFNASKQIATQGLNIGKG